MADQVLFLSITTDEDLILKTQEAVSASAMATAVSAAPAGLGYIVCGVGDDINIGDVPISDLGAGDLDLPSNTITAQSVYFTSFASGSPASEILGAGTLGVSGAANFGAAVSAVGTITGAAVSATTITASTCPIPPPWSCVQLDSNDGVNRAIYYWASGATQTLNELDAAQIAWDGTNNYFTVATAGFYELQAIGSVTIATSPTTITLSIIETLGLGGFEVEKNAIDQVTRTNTDPHLVAIQYMGYFDAGVKITCKIEGTSNVRQGAGSSLSCKRIT